MTEQMIREDPSNNSVWSYRYFIVAKTKKFGVEIYKSEIEFAL